MREVLKELEEAFRLISEIPVSGDSVDVMAAARAKLRRAYAKLTKPTEAAVESAESEDN